MRSLQHVLWRGAMALALFVGGGAGILALPHVAASACAPAMQRNLPRAQLPATRMLATHVGTLSYRC